MTANKRRTDACLKACEGISTQNLEDNVPFLELARRYNVVLRERDAMLAKIAEMEKQEPVFWWRPCSDGAYEGPIHNSSIERVRKQSGAWSPLYKLPGAQPAPSIPEGWKLVPIEPTPGMIDAAEYVDWGDADVRGSCINAWDRMLEAAPEAKP